MTKIDQSLLLQKDALSKEGCTEIYKKKASGKNAEHSELQKMLVQLRKSD